MEKATFNLPAMWADHHVLAVREALGSVEGVEEVIASSLYRDVLVKYDEAKADPARLAGALESAGYDTATSPVLPTYPERIDDASDWSSPIPPTGGPDCIIGAWSGSAR